MRNTDFCICENKAADQLYSNCTADQCLCFRHTDPSSTFIHNFKLLSFFCDCSGLFVSGLIRNPEDCLSHVVAHMYNGILCQIVLRKKFIQSNL